MWSSRLFSPKGLTSRPGMRCVASCALGCCPFYSTAGHSASCAEEGSLGLGSGSSRVSPGPVAGRKRSGGEVAE